MYFKLSARELEILDSQRQVILGTLLQHQSSGRPRNQKPPFLVVPFDPSGLICIIQIEEEVRKSETTLNENKERQQRCNKHLHSNVSCDKILSIMYIRLIYSLPAILRIKI
jgi:hypothetical protein